MATKKEKSKSTVRREEEKTTEEEGEGLTCPKRPAVEREAHFLRSVEKELQQWLAEPSKSAQPHMREESRMRDAHEKKHTDGRGDQLGSRSPQPATTAAEHLQQEETTENNENKKEEKERATKKQQMANPEEEEEEEYSEIEEGKGKVKDILALVRGYMESFKEWQTQEFNDLRRRINNTEEKVNKIDMTLTEMGKKMDKMEERAVAAEMEVEDLKKKLEVSNKKTKETQELLAQKIDIMENYNRRNNIKIVGLKEDEEGKNMREFIKECSAPNHGSSTGTTYGS
ncbi:protein GrpE-like [Narcine bancroftii]|uniref:protein GrpE-like n=1 Tax=Narcine bancroftii TaxID=1343680 RepID=UPI003830FCE7